MCSNYRPVTQMDRLLTYFGVELAPGDSTAPDIWPLGLAPFIRLAHEGSGNREALVGHFGLVPHFAKELAFGKRSYNARSETVATLPSFRDAWRRSQRCIVPAEAIFEPCWETGRAVRWRIERPDGIPMGIAGIYASWRDPEGKERHTFAMLTVNADGHPVFGRMHRPDDEKRIVVILDPQQYDEWLTCRLADAPTFFRQWTKPLHAEADPLPPRVKAPTPPKRIDPETGELFD